MAAGDHLHRPEEEVFLGIGLAAARLAGRPLEPLARHDVAVMTEAGKQVRVRIGKIPAQQRPEQGPEPGARKHRMPATRMQPAVELGGDVEELVQQRLHPLLGSAGAEELRSQGDAVERALPLERHPGAEQRLDGRPRRAPRLAGDEQDARDLDVRQLRQLPATHRGGRATIQ